MHLTFRVGTEPLAARDNDEAGTSELIGARGTYSRSPWFSRKKERGGGERAVPAPMVAKVTETSDALDLEDNILKSRSARRIAASLKHSAEHSRRRKAGPFPLQQED